MTTTITDRQIRALRSESATHGDLRQAAICDLAIGGTAALTHTPSDPSPEAAQLVAEGMTQNEARAECARVIADAEAQA